MSAGGESAVELAERIRTRGGGGGGGDGKEGGFWGGQKEGGGGGENADPGEGSASVGELKEWSAAPYVG